MNLIAGIETTSGALAAQKIRLDIVAQNIANAQTTRTPEGGPYRRKIVSFENYKSRTLAVPICILHHFLSISCN